MARYSIIYRDQDSPAPCVLHCGYEVGRGLAGYRERPAPRGEVCTDCLTKEAPILGTVLGSLDYFHELGSYQTPTIPDEIQLMAFVLVSLRQFSSFADDHWTLNENRVSMMWRLNEEIERLENRYGPLWRMAERPSQKGNGIALLAWDVRCLEAKYHSIFLHAAKRDPAG